MNEDFWPGFIFATVIWVFIMFWMKSAVDTSWKTQIEQHGCAGYYLDANRNKQWDWKK